MSLVLDFTQMFLAVGKDLEMAIVIILNNPYQCNYSKNSLPGEVLALALHLDVFGAGLHPDGPECPEKPEINPVLHTEQPLLQQLSQKIDSWGCPGPGPPGTCRRLPR